MSKIIFLHHSTGECIWRGNTNPYLYRLTGSGDVKRYFRKLNRKARKKHSLSERNFPAKIPYGWKNYPFDYYNIWVKNAGDNPYMNEPTLEILTKEYDVIIFKHCYPVSIILEDTGKPDINSDEKRLENYKLQYEALKEKMHEFPETRFIVWTPAVRVKSGLTEDQALRTSKFHRWMLEEWYEKGDNIYIWDFYNYETEGGLYLKEEYSMGNGNSHPSKKFSARLAPLFAKYIMDVAENKFE